MRGVPVRAARALGRVLPLLGALCAAFALGVIVRAGWVMVLLAAVIIACGWSWRAKAAALAAWVAVAVVMSWSRSAVIPVAVVAVGVAVWMLLARRSALSLSMRARRLPAPHRSVAVGAVSQWGSVVSSCGLGQRFEDRVFAPTVVDVYPSAVGPVLVARLVVGQTVDDVLRAAPALASAWGVPEVRVSVAAPGVVALTLVTSDPLSETVRHDGAADVIGVDEPWVIGRSEEGSLVTLDMASGSHTLIAGATRSGKSVCVYGLLTHLLRMGDSVRLLVADPNETTVAPFEDKVAWFTTSTHPNQVALGLRWVQAEVQRRKPIMRAMRKDRLSVEDFTPDMPLIVVVIDELANYLRHADKKAASALTDDLLVQASQNAKYGVRLVLITQRPDSTILSTSIRAQIASRISFRLEDSETARMVFPDLDDPLTMMSLPPGVGFMRGFSDDLVVKFRGVYLEDHWAMAERLPAQPRIAAPSETGVE